MRHIIPISGKDSLATALVQLQREPDLPYEYMFNPTGAELPEVFDWMKKVEAYLGKEIIFVGDDLEEMIIHERNYFLPSFNARYCTREAKIKPMEKWIGKDECTIYYGIRADEDRGGYKNASGLITVALPLVEEGVGIDGVYEIISFHGLKPPTFFWKSVYKRVCDIFGESLIKKLLKEWQIDMLFAWRSRANCYFCFNQRLYEWCGLLEHYPDLFWNAESMEHKGSEGTYSWNASRTLKWVSENTEKIIEKRVKALVKIIQDLQQGKLVFYDEDGFNDILATTSCGLFCGK